MLENDCYTNATDVRMLPRGYDLSFSYRDAINEEQHYTLTLKVTQDRLVRLFELLRFHGLGHTRLKTVLPIPTTLRIMCDYESQDNVLMNKLESTECFVVMDRDVVMLYLAGLPHGVKLPYTDFSNHVCDLTLAMTGNHHKPFFKELARDGIILREHDTIPFKRAMLSSRGTLLWTDTEVVLAQTIPSTPSIYRVMATVARYTLQDDGFLAPVAAHKYPLAESFFHQVTVNDLDYLNAGAPHARKNHPHD